MHNELNTRPDAGEAVSPSASWLVGNRIEALRSLAALLLQEVDSLEDGLSFGPAKWDKESLNLSDEIERIEVDMIRHALILAGGNQRKAAAILGTKAPTLNSKIKRYGAERFSDLGRR